MTTRVEKTLRFAVHIAAKYNGASRDTSGDKITLLSDFGIVPDIDPALGEDLAYLLLLNGRRDQRLAA